MEPTVHYLNLAYLLTRTYDFVAGLSFPLSAIPHWVITVAYGIVFLGMGLSLILLVGVVYAQIMMVQTEHEGFHALEEEEHEAHVVAHETHGAVVETHKNSRWEDIMVLATSANESDRRRAILEADIMLGDALTTAGYTGTSVGEQLKLTNPLQVKSLRSAWDAHMMRNKVAHSGEGFALSQRDTQITIDQYKRVFEEFNFL